MKREDLAAIFAPPVRQSRPKRDRNAHQPKYFFTNWSEKLLRTAILLRYGTLDLPAKPIMSYSKVAQKVGKPTMPLWRRMKKYEQTGEFILQRRWGNGSVVDVELEKKLCNQ